MPKEKNYIHLKCLLWNIGIGNFFLCCVCVCVQNCVFIAMKSILVYLFLFAMYTVNVVKKKRKQNFNNRILSLLLSFVRGWFRGVYTTCYEMLCICLLVVAVCPYCILNTHTQSLVYYQNLNLWFLANFRGYLIMAFMRFIIDNYDTCEVYYYIANAMFALPSYLLCYNLLNRYFLRKYFFFLWCVCVCLYTVWIYKNIL